MDPTRTDEPHPDARAFLRRYEAADVPPFEEVTPREARELMERMQPPAESTVSLESVEDRTIDGPRDDLRVRIYDPGTGGEREAAASRPGILYFHGGGWVLGSVETHDGTCRTLAAESGYPVVSVDYALAPEHPFPAGLCDCYAALEWLADAASELGIDPDRIALAGDSAGGNLAAATALLARDRDGPSIAYQVLVYPVTGDPTDTDAYEENADGYLLTADEIAWFRRHYFEDPIDEGNVYAFPRRAADLSALPPATIVTAGFDPVRDDGAAYADRLEEAGVAVTYRNYEDMIHGFFGMTADPVAFDRAHEAVAAVVDDLESALE
ncbi:alpha/beta hydrolase [Natrarchaeobius oligotrophus]|uniref:Alpha/beta hydrolase n=1 Tax=Natrarchaeobius chitinivorans TaxID=1679083 RepID=A0A3N6NNU4_NATCH|nr:alpha/beta hydrolase [Natrarchaeobius chitinivorans]RQH01263.1 alpha/beta hydrolase [Natrarchaeobius chitinivorans]